MASKGSKVTTRQHSKQSKTDGASINMEDSILISEEDLDEAPLWGRALSQNFKELSVLVNSKMEETRTLISDCTGAIEAASQTAINAQELALKNAEIIKVLVNKVDQLTCDNVKNKTKLDTVCEENSKLKEHILKNESYSRKENLVFRGITATNEPCEKIVRDILSKMNINGLDHKSVPIVNCHYVNSAKSQIIARFLIYSDRDKIWSSRRSLKTVAPEIYLAEDFPSEIEYRRRQLYPIVAAANRSDEYRQKVKLNADQLFLNNKRYSHTTINQLPSKLHPKTLSEKSSESLLVVGGITSRYHPLSNFYQNPLELDNETFMCAEQAFQYEKAVLFKDYRTARQIMCAVDPGRMKYLGSKVNAFNFTVWKDNQDGIMKRVLSAKFTHDDDIKKVLLDTGTRTIGEANAKDSYWAIGLPLTSQHVLDKDKWATGGNKLGILLMDIRHELLQ